MTRLTICALVALLTFMIGLVSAKLIAYRHTNKLPLKVEVSRTPDRPPASQAITFSSDGIISSFQPWYHSSDGAFLRYGCFEYASLSDVARGLRDEIYGFDFGKHIVERALKLNEKGERIGERVVLAESLGSEKKAMIVWTEGPRLYLIRAPSLKYALLFEQSQVWAGEDYCVTVDPLWRH